MKKTYIAAGIAVLVLLIASGAYAFMLLRSPSPVPPATTHDVTQYSCTEGAFTALFTDGQVVLTFPESRTLTLPQSVSGSGVRYEKDGTAFVGKGSDAFITENGTTTYTDCVASASDTSGGTDPSLKAFTDSGKTFRFSYPSAFAVTGGGVGYTTDWMNNSMQTGLVLARVTIPRSFQPNTNFSEARFTVGTSADPVAVKECFTEKNGNPTKATKVTINGTSYTKLVEGDAGAGNFYETTSYRTIRNDQCYVVEYTIHSTNLGNYSPDQGITQFDTAAVTAALETMAQSLTFL